MGWAPLRARGFGRVSKVPRPGRVRLRTPFLASVTALLFAATSAVAAPITFFFTTGSADITATAGSTTVVDTTIALDGAYVTFDDAIPAVVGFEITAPQSGPIGMLSAYGGFDTFVVESATITPGGSFSNYSVTPTGPSTWTFLVGPVDVAGVYSASNSGGSPPPVSNLPVPFSGMSFLNGSIDTDLGTFEMLGITLAELDGAAFGEADDLIIKADITWSGGSTSGDPVPEPGTATLLGGGLAALAARRRSQMRTAPSRSHDHQNARARSLKECTNPETR